MQVVCVTLFYSHYAFVPARVQLVLSGVDQGNRFVFQEQEEVVTPPHTWGPKKRGPQQKSNTEKARCVFVSRHQSDHSLRRAAGTTLARVLHASPNSRNALVEVKRKKGIPITRARNRGRLLYALPFSLKRRNLLSGHSPRQPTYKN